MSGGVGHSSDFAAHRPVPLLSTNESSWQELESILDAAILSPDSDPVTISRATELKQHKVPGFDLPINELVGYLAVTPYLCYLPGTNQSDFRVYLHQHKKSGLLIGPGGGHLDQGEGIMAALAREMREELGPTPAWKFAAARGTSLFDIGVFGSNGQMKVDLRFALIITEPMLNTESGRLILRERPGEFAELYTLSDIERRSAEIQFTALDSDYPYRWSRLRKQLNLLLT